MLRIFIFLLFPCQISTAPDPSLEDSSSGERPRIGNPPQYVPKFSRFTPFLTPQSLPGPQFGRASLAAQPPPSLRQENHHHSGNPQSRGFSSQENRQEDGRQQTLTNFEPAIFSWNSGKNDEMTITTTTMAISLSTMPAVFPKPRELMGGFDEARQKEAAAMAAEILNRDKKEGEFAAVKTTHIGASVANKNGSDFPLNSTTTAIGRGGDGVVGNNLPNSTSSPVVNWTSSPLPSLLSSTSASPPPQFATPAFHQIHSFSIKLRPNVPYNSELVAKLAASKNGINRGPAAEWNETEQKPNGEWPRWNREEGEEEEDGKAASAEENGRIFGSKSGPTTGGTIGNPSRPTSNVADDRKNDGKSRIESSSENRRHFLRSGPNDGPIRRIDSGSSEGSEHQNWDGKGRNGLLPRGSGEERRGNRGGGEWRPPKHGSREFGRQFNAGGGGGGGGDRQFMSAERPSGHSIIGEGHQPPPPPPPSSSRSEESREYQEGRGQQRAPNRAEGEEEESGRANQSREEFGHGRPSHPAASPEFNSRKGGRGGNGAPFQPPRAIPRPGEFLPHHIRASFPPFPQPFDFERQRNKQPRGQGRAS